MSPYAVKTSSAEKSDDGANMRRPAENCESGSIGEVNRELSGRTIGDSRESGRGTAAWRVTLGEVWTGDCREGVGTIRGLSGKVRSEISGEVEIHKQPQRGPTSAGPRVTNVGR